MKKKTVDTSVILSTEPDADAAFLKDMNDIEISLNRCDLLKVLEKDVDETGEWWKVESLGKVGFLNKSLIIDWPDDCEKLAAESKITKQKHFAWACLLNARVYKVNGAALMAIAFAESGDEWVGSAKTGSIREKVNKTSGNIGPFQFSQDLWNKLVKENPKEGLDEFDIELPRKQCVFAAILMRRAWDEITKETGEPPSTLDLYLARIFGVELSRKLFANGVTPEDTISSILGDEIVATDSFQRMIEAYQVLLPDKGDTLLVKFIQNCEAILDRGLKKVPKLYEQLAEFQVETPEDTPRKSTTTLAKRGSVGLDGDAGSAVELALNIVKEFEGLHDLRSDGRIHAYPDPRVGWSVPTIGYGTTQYPNGRRVQKGDSITKKEAEEFVFENMVKNYLPRQTRIPHWKEMSTRQRAAILSFAYNLGSAFYGGKNFSTITRVLKEKDWISVPAALMLYRNPGSNVERGLARRRRAEGKLWSQGMEIA